MLTRISVITACVLTFWLVPASVQARDDLSVFGKQHARVAVLNAGQALMNKGFPGYASAPYVGLDLFIPWEEPGLHWWSRSSWRASFEYFPLVLPDGVYGTTEDLLGLTCSQVWFVPLAPASRTTVMMGLGAGVYMDWIRMDTPATGAYDLMQWHPGGTMSIGVGYRISDAIELVPEARVHALYVARDYFAVVSSVHVGISWWFARR